jgi:hypothetical protein
MYEKRFKTIAPQAFTSSGTVDGKLTVIKACLFRVGQHVIIEAIAQPPLLVQIKRIETDGITVYVGPCRTNIQTRTDISAYTVIGNATIRMDEQNRTSVPEQEIERLTYEEEPVVARRSILVDCLGRPYATDNPVPIQGSVSVTINGVTAGVVLNVPAPLANTEYTVTVPTTAKRFLIRMRNASRCQLSYTVGTTGTNYITMNAGTVYAEDSLMLNAPLSVYFRPSKPNETAEVVYWT